MRICWAHVCERMHMITLYARTCNKDRQERKCCAFQNLDDLIPPRLCFVCKHTFMNLHEYVHACTYPNRHTWLACVQGVRTCARVRMCTGVCVCVRVSVLECLHACAYTLCTELQKPEQRRAWCAAYLFESISGSAQYSTEIQINTKSAQLPQG